MHSYKLLLEQQQSNKIFTAICLPLCQCYIKNNGWNMKNSHTVSSALCSTSMKVMQHIYLMQHAQYYQFQRTPIFTKVYIHSHLDFFFSILSASGPYSNRLSTSLRDFLPCITTDKTCEGKTWSMIDVPHNENSTTHLHYNNAIMQHHLDALIMLKPNKK